MKNTYPYERKTSCIDIEEKGEAAAQEEMKNLTGGLPLPPGMKLPF